MQYALDSVQYAENIARLLQCIVNGNLLRYIIKPNYSIRRTVSEIILGGASFRIFTVTDILFSVNSFSGKLETKCDMTLHFSFDIHFFVIRN